MASHGAIQRWRTTLIPTTREAPADAEAPSHILLSRAGYIRKVGAGIYDYLPLAWRVLRKISQIIREEMDAAGASELAMPTLVPVELYAGTKRDQTYGELLFKLTDRKGAVEALGPTHEETVTELMKGSVTSYKQLPLNVYQITAKFRDEARPRSGILRGREFIMKDAYSFHLEVEGPGGLNETYDAMYRAYVNSFRRCGLDFTVVEAESGPIGGSASHEFMVNCASGEDTILKCPVSGYAANVEKCEIGEREWTLDGAPTGELTEVHTPNLPGIDEVGKFMKVKPDRMLKTILFRTNRDVEFWDRVLPRTNKLDRMYGKEEGQRWFEEQLESHDYKGDRWIVAVVRGDHEVNEGKVKALAGESVVLAEKELALETGFAVGYVSPRAALRFPSTLLLIDADAAQGGFWATGADKVDHHVKHFNWRRDVGAVLDNPDRVKVGDLRNAVSGDPSPRAPGAKLEIARGIEVGHIFKLGTKYSDAMGFQILDHEQHKRSVIMGCYGIGVSRTMAACVEMSHDQDGIIWPAAIAPYHVLITVMKPDAAEQMQAADRIAAGLSEAGLDVLIDDRDERPGVKFKDADLIGIPIRLTIGDKSLAEGAVEFKLRKDKGKGENVPIGDIVRKCVEAAGA